MSEPADDYAGPGSDTWHDQLRKLAEPPTSERRRQAHRAGDALRRLMAALHGTSAPPAEVAAIADEVERLADRLAPYPSTSLYLMESDTAGPDPVAFFDHSAVLGQGNPLAPPISLWRDGDVMRGRATFGAPYEGPPDCVHGGFVAAAFDEVLGSSQALGGRPGMTARLIVDYRSPTPLHTELSFAAGVRAVEGRKTVMWGTLHAGERLCAEAEGLFVAVESGPWPSRPGAGT